MAEEPPGLTSQKGYLGIFTLKRGKLSVLVFLFMLRRSYEASRTRSVGLSVGWSVGRLVGLQNKAWCIARKIKCMNQINWTNGID